MTHFIGEIRDWIKDTARYYNTIIELSRLSDKELNDLGMTRFEIAHIAGQQFLNKRLGE